jgi:hypothetical protein
MLLVIPAIPVFASLDIVGLAYNFNAIGSEPALTIIRSNTNGTLNYRYTYIKADQFVIKANERSISDIETRIQQTIYDMIVDVTPLSQLDADSPEIHNPPILLPCEKIVGNKLYIYPMYFAIHIYSLDNPSTPQGELKFITRFQDGMYGTIEDNWWVE